MKEDFLHYVWKFKKFDFLNAKTTTGEAIRIINFGLHNQQAGGPDFFNAKIEVGSQLWAGNVEIHLKASDWYAHYHETDAKYDNVILHVVWEEDVKVFRKDETPIPCLELNALVDKNAVKNYQKLLAGQAQYLNCENDFSKVDDFLLNNWIERLYVERLEIKHEFIAKLLEKTRNNWEAVLFLSLAKNFGLNKNGSAFLQVAESISIQVVQKIKLAESLEALLMGQAGMLDQEIEDAYFQKLQKDYFYLRHKYQLRAPLGSGVQYFRLRPHNFPTIRLSQLAHLYVSTPNLFSKIKETSSKKDLYRLLNCTGGEYWQTHYSFGKSGKKSKKALSEKFKDLLIINTIVPILFSYYQSLGKSAPEHLFGWMRNLPAEQNAVVKKFNSIRPKTATNALASQAILHLKNNYCDKNRCLQCAVGLNLLKRK